MRKKYLLGICLFVILMSMSCISASENVNQTDSLGLSIEDNFETAEDDQKIIRSTNNEDELKENKNQTMNSNILAISNEDEILGANDIYVKGDTFESISNAINGAQDGDIIHLNGTYTNNWGKHIEIDREISIIGKDNATLDAQGFSRIFYVNSGKINIQNIVFKNGNADYGGAIYFNKAISDSNINATFINNTATFGGANRFSDVLGSNVTGTYTNNTAEDYGGANIFVSVSCSNVTGTYTNNKAEVGGGANYFIGSVSGSNITGTYTNNTAEDYGGANIFVSVSGSNVTGTYTNNNAAKGGANYFHNGVSGSNVTGTYTNNKAEESGGANYFYDDVSGTNITGTYINNKAEQHGGAIYFFNNQGNVKMFTVSGIYINNTANGGAIIHFNVHDLFPQPLNSTVKHAIFLNNHCEDIFYVGTNVVVATNNWFGNNASNYKEIPKIDNLTMTNWLFLNATADYTSLLVMDSTNITFKLNSTDGTRVFGFDNSKLPVVNLTLTATNGDVDKTTQLDKTVKYKATSKGTGTVTAKIENAQYTIYFDNNLRNVDLSVSAENITYLENEILTLTYNNTATGKVNITLNSTKYNKKIEADINHTITIADLPLGEYNVTVEYSGDNVFSNATAYANFIVEKMPTEVIVDNKTMDLFVDDEFKITYTLNPDYAVGNIAFSSDDSSIVGVDSVSGDIQAKAEGTAIITVTFGGSENYTASSTNITIFVSKIPTEINITNETVELKAHQSIGNLATLNPKLAGNLTYASSDENIVGVSDGGIIYARIKGTAIVTVSFAGDDKYKAAESKNITVIVTLNDARVSVENDTLDLFVDDTYIINAKSNPSFLTVYYTSSDESVATVTDYGNVKAVGEGTAIITLTVGNDETYAINYTDVKVTVSKVPTEITVNPASLDLFVGDETVIIANLTPRDAGNVTFTSSDDSVVTVDNQGNVIAEGKGTAIITVSFAGDNKYAAENKSITVKVSLNDARVTVDNNTLDLKVDETYKINATKHPDTIMLDITYKSSDESVASVDKNGIVTAISEGTAIITLEVGDDVIYAKNSTTVTVAVKKISTDISIANATVNLNVDDEVSTNAKLNPEEVGNLTYTSSDESVAVVKDGKIIALKEGDAIITVSFKGNNKYAEAKNKTIKVSVKKLNPSMNITADEITEGENATINIELPIDATGNVTTTVNGKTYSSKVDNGKAIITIPGLEYGNYTLPVTYSGGDKYDPLTKDVDLTVKEDKIIVSAQNLTKYYSGNERFTVNVAYANGRAIAGKEVKITINGVTYKRTTDENGSASLSINLNSATYDTVVEVDNITVGSIVMILPTIEAEDVESKSKNLTFTAAFLDGEGNYLKNGTNVSFNINGVIYDSYVNDDKGSVSLNLTLDRGRYIITSYNPVSGESVSNNIAVDLKDADMILSGDEITAGENATIGVTLPGDATGNVTTSLNGKNYTSQVNNGKADIIIPDLTSGNYTISVTYSGDNNYNPAVGEVNITVNENATVTINAENLTKYYKDSEKFTVKITDAKGQPAANKTVEITINGVTYKRTTDENGTASLSINLNSGVYPVRVVVDGVEANFTVTVQSTIDSSDIVKIFRNGTQYNAIFTDSNGKPLANIKVSFNIHGVIYNRTTDRNGASKLNINLDAGDYIITAFNSATGEMKSNTIKVISLIESDDLTKYFRNASQFVVRIHSADGAYVGAGEEVSFNINGVIYTRLTNATGHAKLNINLAQGNYIITTYYNSCRRGNNIEVLPILTAEDLSMKYMDGSQFKAKLVDGKGNPYPNKEITFNINGVFYNRLTDNDGIAKLNIRLMAGQYIITSSYDGCNIANKITIWG